MNSNKYKNTPRVLGDIEITAVEMVEVRSINKND